MANVIVEINGVRHKLVKTRCSGNVCSQCSLEGFCPDIIATPCVGMNTRFMKERKKKDDGKK